MKTKFLPIHDILPELLRTIPIHANTILQAPPGAGKTTQVPLALLDLFPAEAGRILMLEPRRLAAVSAARWMAAGLGEEVGRTIGYSIRFDSRVSAATRIEVVTEGILTRRIQNDPLLEGVAVVIFDEFHERSLQTDLGLALCLDVQRQVRHDLKILIMSATLECEPLMRLLNEPPLITSQGRSFPVEEIYLDDLARKPLTTRIVETTIRALKETQGDVLIFLPGAGEIRSCATALAENGLAEQGILINPLYGDLPFEEQQQAIMPGKQRKVVLATSIAETSLTIEGVRVVIDCGMSRRLRHDPASGMNRLVTVRESRASAEQRKGRAGRLDQGRCYRLFSRHTFSAMTPHTSPEILETDLSPLLLELAAWGASPFELAWLDPPPQAALAVANQLLLYLSAFDSNGRITPGGSAMARLPLHPRLARLLLRSNELGCVGLGCDLAALLSERDIIRRHTGGAAGDFFDIADRLDLLGRWRLEGSTGGVADKYALKAIDRVAHQLLRSITAASRSPADYNDPDNLGRLLLSAYPDRVGRHRETESDRYLLASGHGVRLAKKMAVSSAPFLIAISVNGGDQGEGIVHVSMPVTEALLRAELGQQIVQNDSIIWDNREGRVVALRGDCLGAVQLSSSQYTPLSEACLQVVLEAVRNSCLTLLSRDETFLQLRARIMLLRNSYPNEGWPDVSDVALLDSLEEWLAPFIIGVRTAQQLSQVNCANVLQSLLDYRKRLALDELAPTHLAVPSGSRIRVDYCNGDLPVLAVKLQELFGLAETPTVAGGRLTVLLHLLSPAGRPIQVTQDLNGFWNGAYHEVKKELKGRYPKHPWPDDPWNAMPTRRAKPRKNP
ncbi:MAG TPA: ATP-dependent helicase HrpB [Desulfuromonadaceae bacterium]